jgi:hypothetical protein
LTESLLADGIGDLSIHQRRFAGSLLRHPEWLTHVQIGALSPEDVEGECQRNISYTMNALARRENMCNVNIIS